MLTSTAPTLDAIRAAALAQQGVVLRTPLVPLRTGAGHTAEHVLLKLETLQAIGSFKIRGVFHAVQSLSEKQRAAGLSTVSAGNTAQALAWCGRHFGVPALCLMPESAPAAKVAAVERLGGTPRLVSRDELFAFLQEHRWEDEPYAFIHPWTEPRLLAGHATLGLELAEQAPELDRVFVPVGGGGLIAGVASALRACSPQTRVIGVEAAGAPALATALEAGRPVAVPCATICDGIAVPYITEEMFPLLRSLVDTVELVDDQAVRAAMRLLLYDNKLLVEPSGAIAVAAALRSQDRGRCACILSGGSVDPAVVVDRPPSL
jgi:threonine dehydratase